MTCFPGARTVLVIIADVEGYGSCCVTLSDRGARVFFNLYVWSVIDGTL